MLNCSGKVTLIDQCSGMDYVKSQYSKFFDDSLAEKVCACYDGTVRRRVDARARGKRRRVIESNSEGLPSGGNKNLRAVDCSD